MAAPPSMQERDVAQMLKQLAVLEKTDPAAFDAVMTAMEKETMGRLSHEAGPDAIIFFIPFITSV